MGGFYPGGGYFGEYSPSGLSGFAPVGHEFRVVGIDVFPSLPAGIDVVPVAAAGLDVRPVGLAAGLGIYARGAAGLGVKPSLPAGLDVFPDCDAGVDDVR